MRLINKRMVLKFRPDNMSESGNHLNACVLTDSMFCFIFYGFERFCYPQGAPKGAPDRQGSFFLNIEPRYYRSLLAFIRFALAPRVLEFFSSLTGFLSRPQEYASRLCLSFVFLEFESWHTRVRDKQKRHGDWISGFWKYKIRRSKRGAPISDREQSANDWNVEQQRVWAS